MIIHVFFRGVKKPWSHLRVVFSTLVGVSHSLTRLSLSCSCCVSVSFVVLGLASCFPSLSFESLESSYSRILCYVCRGERWGLFSEGCMLKTHTHTTTFWLSLVYFCAWQKVSKVCAQQRMSNRRWREQRFKKPKLVQESKRSFRLSWTRVCLLFYIMHLIVWVSQRNATKTKPNIWVIQMSTNKCFDVGIEWSILFYRIFFYFSFDVIKQIT